MALNPLREALGLAGRNAFQQNSSFKAEADTALARFQTHRDDLERQVKRGDLTVKVAREKARDAAAELKTVLMARSEGYSPVPRAFMDRLIEAGNARKRAKETMGVEGLQRETNRLLRLTLIEQQLASRAAEFEGQTFTRAVPGGKLVPTLDSLLAFHEAATRAGDEAAAEWGRRQLEGMRNRVGEPVDVRRIDAACDRPDAVNPRLVTRYVEALQGADLNAMETFVDRAIDGRDANACVAAFVLAREVPDGAAVRWVRNVLNGVAVFPDAALNTLRAAEAEARGEDAKSARAQVEYAVALAEAQVKFSGVEAPDDNELARQVRVKARPVAGLGEPIGLALDRRGVDPRELTEIETDAERSA